MKPKMRLLLSLTGGLLLGVSIWVYLKRAESRLNAQVRMVSVLRARKFVPAGKPLALELIEESRVPEAYLEPNALCLVSDVRDSKGNFIYQARTSFVKGEQITKSRLVKTGAPFSLSWIVPPGQSAQTLRLSLEQAVGGHLQPGDDVDILCTLDSPSGGSGPHTIALFTGIRVLAVNDRMWEEGAINAKNDLPSSDRDFILITVALPIVEETVLALGADKGRLCLALTSPLNSITQRPRDATMKDLQKG